MPKKLYRSRTSRTIAGVCGGLGEYLNIDPTLVRVLCVLLAFWGPGLIAYIIMACVVPETPEQAEAWQPPYAPPPPPPPVYTPPPAPVDYTQPEPPPPAYTPPPAEGTWQPPAEEE